MNKKLSDINIILNNIKKNKYIKHIGKSHKASVCLACIDRLNSDNSTSFYLERDGKTFTIQGHREYGSISLRTGDINNNIDMTLGGNEIPFAGTTNTIKMVIDSIGNYIVVSLTRMKDYGLLDNLSNPTQRCVKFSDNRFFYSWPLDELDKIGAILYRSI